MDVKIIKVNAKKAFTPTKIPGANYVLNQYIGCQHACLYCYAKFVCRWHKHGEWGNWVIAKQNFPELVKKERERVNGKVYMSSVSDPYQPIEKEIKLTREILESMDKDAKLGILTKSDLVLRDIDLFKKFQDVEVGLTINSVDGKMKRDVEPFSPTNEKRMDALKSLFENGIKTYAFISPIIPKLTDVEKIIEETKDFVDFYWFEFLNLRASGKKFRSWLMENYPESNEILANKEKMGKFVKEVMQTIKNSKVEVRGVCIHYPKIESLKFQN